MKYEWDSGAGTPACRADTPGSAGERSSPRFDYGEERLITLGLLAGRVLVIAHAPRGPATRIISMRKANRREQEIYYKRLEES
jgi:uncharacterized DUF497 family protein